MRLDIEQSSTRHQKKTLYLNLYQKVFKSYLTLMRI